MGQFLFNGNRRIYYEKIDGPSSKPSLVFLHEGLGCTAMWKDFPHLLCERTGLPGLSYDRSGYGQSSASQLAKTPKYLHDAALEELPRVLRQLLPDRPYVLIGHSDGGTIALIHGAERPPLLRGAITEAAHVFVEPETLSGIRDISEAFALGKNRGLRRYHGEKTTHMFDAWKNAWLADSAKHWNIENLLRSIDCPVLAIQGRDDQYGTEAQIRSIVSNIGATARPLVIDNCGHVPHHERTDDIVEAMSEFIVQVCSRPSRSKFRNPG